MRASALPRFVAALVTLAALTLSLEAKSSKWTDAQGATFRGEPIEALGPFALFKTGGANGRVQPFRALKPEEYPRFHAETSVRPAIAARWADAKGSITRELLGNTFELKGDELVPAALANRPEPAVIIVLFACHGNGPSWRLATTFSPTIRRIERIYPGLTATVFMGVRHTAAEHKRLAQLTRMPWLIADLTRQQEMTLARFAPPDHEPSLLAISRDGVPLLSSPAGTMTDVKKFADTLSELLWQASPANPRTWQDRVQYGNAIRPLQFADQKTGPVLVGDPLRPETLRPYGVTKVAATLTNAADGTLTDAAILPSSKLPDGTAPALATALKKHAVILPAIDHGKPVAGTCDYLLEIPPENRQHTADLAWITGEGRVEIPLKSWLVLSPVRVPEGQFQQIERVADDGTVMLKAVSASTGKVSHSNQMSAFNSNWFDAAGPASVRPIEGAAQTVDDTPLKWRKVVPTDSIIDFAGESQNLNYCIGYAWTEFDAPADSEAWLAIGTDDGAKVWHNGDLVNDRWGGRASRLDDDVVPLKLTKGKNQLLIKIQNGTGAWSFLCRIRTR